MGLASCRVVRTGVLWRPCGRGTRGGLRPAGTWGGLIFRESLEPEAARLDLDDLLEVFEVLDPTELGPFLLDRSLPDSEEESPGSSGAADLVLRA